MTDHTAATPEPPQQPGNATNQRAASEAKKYRLRAKEAEGKLAAANDHVTALRLHLATNAIRNINERRLTEDGHSIEPAYVHSPNGEPVRRELLEMVLNSLDVQLGSVLDVSYVECNPHRNLVQVKTAADLFQRDADGTPTDQLNMKAIHALLRTLGRMDGFKAPPSKPKVTMPTISATKPSRPATNQSALAYALPRAVRPYQRDQNIWPRG